MKNWIFSRKGIFVIVGILLLGEIAWAAWTLTRSGSQPEVTVAPSVSSASDKLSATVTLSAERSTVKKGDKLAVSINMQSVRPTDGTDLIILYDPKLLTVVSEKGKPPVSVGSTYSDYPINSIDEKTGRIIVSGISSQNGGVLAKGVFGTVVFQAKELGETKVSFDFTAGSTTDSNIIEAETGRDLLSKVNNLQITITP